MDLILGVIDIPYAHYAPVEIQTKKGKRVVTKKVGVLSTTTGEVAKILEEKYEVMAEFVIAHNDDIQKAVTSSIEGHLINMLVSGITRGTGFEEAMDEIQEEFKKYLDAEEMAGFVPGVPTQAALMGVNHRLGRSTGPRRPSFIDTGLYQKSFKCWVE